MQDATKLTNDYLAGPHAAGEMPKSRHWSPRKAAAVAESLGIALTDDHWLVIYALREYYRTHGRARARTLAAYLEHEGGQSRRELYDLFPGGPVLQGSMIAGLPPPDDVADRSFGSVH